MELDNITFGNPTRQHYSIMRKISYLDNVIGQFSVVTFPANSSDTTLEELNKIVELTHLLNVDPETQKRYAKYDADILSFFKESIPDDLKESVGPEKINELKKLIDEITEDVMPIVIKLKYMFQRPRPYQLGNYYKMALYPSRSNSSNSPSYPSGHACLSEVICAVIATHYPRLLLYYQQISIDFNHSRLLLGLHYQTDISAGTWLAKMILNDIQFKVKFKL